MDNHPIPQDITGFQFKLIGSMTVKQFAYLATGVVIAWFIFFILSGFIFIRLPLAIIFLGLGVSLAFVPIDGRPMDLMITNLLKAIFAPTRYIYKKEGGSLSSQTLQPSSVPSAQTQQTQAPAPAQQNPIVSSIQPMQNQPMPTANMQPQAGPASFGPVIELPDSQNKPIISGNLDDLVNEKKEEEKKVLENEKKLEEEVVSLKDQLEAAKQAEGANANQEDQTSAHQKTEELEKALTQTLKQKEAIEKQLLTLQAKLEGQKQEKFAPSTSAPPRQTQRVKKVPPGMEKSVGLPNMPQDPNVISGIVKDSRGNPLPNILVEVKDPEENPVRAFKTNGLGQFASATALSNGRYVVVFEDPKEEHKFDAVEIEANGQIMMPLEIVSIDAREELRRELFA